MTSASRGITSMHLYVCIVIRISKTKHQVIGIPASKLYPVAELHTYQLF